MAYVREVSVKYSTKGRRAKSPIHLPANVADYMERRIDDDSRECFVAIFVDARHRPIGDRVISIGTATASLVHPREVFQAAILIGAQAIILAHNHPSGDVSPSREDREITTRLREAGKLLGIRLLDHIVWSRGSGFHSLQESGDLDV